MGGRVKVRIGGRVEVRDRTERDAISKILGTMSMLYLINSGSQNCYLQR